MTNKSSEWSAKKEKKGTSNPDTKSYKKKASPAKPKTPPTFPEPILKHVQSAKSVTEPTKPSVGLFDAKKKKLRVKKSRSRVCSFISLSIVSYLGYYALYACGSPFENNEKPAICARIDPIKLDLYSVYQSNFFKTNAVPHVSLIEKGNRLNIKYGVPAQFKLSQLFSQNSKPLAESEYVGAFQGYKQKVERLYLAKVAPLVNPYLVQAEPYYDQQSQIYRHQLQVLWTQSTQKGVEARAFLQHKMDNLNPHIKLAKEAAQAQVQDWTHRAENTDLLPIWEKYYWILVDFIQFELLPTIKASHVVTEMNLYYHANMKHYVDLNIKPVLAPLPVSKILRFIEAHLPTKPGSVVDQVYAATTVPTQIKTSLVVPKTQDIPITPPAVSAEKTVTITKSTAPAVATNLHKPEPTIDQDGNSNDIVQEKSVKPTAATEYAPDAGEAEAIYVPTCNSAEEQLVVANTDKRLVAVYTDKDLFEILKEEEQIVIQAPIQHAGIVFRMQTEAPVVEDAFETVDPTAAVEENIETEVPGAAEEDIVFSIQTEAPTAVAAEEETIFSIQTEVPTAAEEDIVFKIQTEAPAAIEEHIVPIAQAETPVAIPTAAEEQTIPTVHAEVPEAILTADEEQAIPATHVETPEAIPTIAKQDVEESEKVQEAQKRQEIKKEENVFVPEAIQKEELVLESRKEHDANNEPVFIKVDEPAAEEHVNYEEPVVKVEDIEGPIVNVKVPVKVEEQQNTVKTPIQE